MRFLGVFIVFENIRVVFRSKFSREAESCDWCCIIDLIGVFIFSLSISFAIDIDFSYFGSISFSIWLFKGSLANYAQIFALETHGPVIVASLRLVVQRHIKIVLLRINSFICGQTEDSVCEIRTFLFWLINCNFEVGEGVKHALVTLVEKRFKHICVYF